MASPAPHELSASRRNQRRDLITLFNGIEPGGEISFEDIYAATGLDAKNNSTDRSLVFAVREHCRDVLFFVVEAVSGWGYRKVRDEELAARVLERRQDRIRRQSVRGMAESMAVGDFAALTQQEQRRILAHQSIFGTLALASRLDVTRRLASDYEKPALTDMHADEVIAAAMKIKQ